MTESVRSLTRLSTAQVRWQCDPQSLGFETTAELKHDERIYGQDDAVEALRYGLETRTHGHNIYVRGLSGFGRMSLVRQMIEEIKPHCKPVPDRCYVYNVESPDQPKLITLPTGKGRHFCRALERFTHFLIEDLAAYLQSDRMKSRQRSLEENAQIEMKRIGEPFDRDLEAAGLALVPMQMGQNVQPVIMPVIEGEPRNFDDLQKYRQEGKLSDADFKALLERISEYEKKVADIGQEVAEAQTKHRESVVELYRNEASALIDHRLGPIRRGFPGEDVESFLDGVRQDLLENRLTDLGNISHYVRHYQANLVLGREEHNKGPVISETNPTLVNLLGKVEREVESSQAGMVSRSDHLMIKAGALLEADGGFLILDAQEILMEPGAWAALLRTLKTGLYELPSLDPLNVWAVPQLKPQAIPVDVKVVLVGDPEIFYLLDHAEPRFGSLFKVLADFSDTLPRDKTGFDAYTGVISRIVNRDDLLHFDAGAVACLIEHGARICGQQGRLTSRFARIADIAREASYLANHNGYKDAEGKAVVNADAVRDAVTRSKRRGDLPARYFRRMVSERTLKISVTGEEVGQVNGLAVTQAGPLTYGLPSRITASIGPGSAGAINIERESDLSGALHTKAFYILGGLMRHLLKVDHPMVFSASIAFEQTYGGIDGDSASGAEFCCLMSALTDVPINQQLAMTGAIDQKGNILPIGAATEKIEGFFDACKSLEYTGEQGVLIPEANADELMLREDVVEAVNEGNFHVYAVSTIQEALSLLTGIEAGERGVGGYPAETVLGMAEARADRFWEVARNGMR